MMEALRIATDFVIVLLAILLCAAALTVGVLAAGAVVFLLFPSIGLFAIPVGIAGIGGVVIAVVESIDRHTKRKLAAKGQRVLEHRSIHG